jgi:hypothetical protein
MAEDAWVSFCFVVVLFSFEAFVLYNAKLLDFITLFTLVLLRPLRGVIFVVVDFYYSILPFVPLWQKGGVIFDLDRDCIFDRSSIFVPEWPKGEFVSL